ncbi:MAG: 50S ribosomal protein L17 [Clostridiales bacterium]|nr:50S ribosomal protein L17 [Clostridiales bacterium]
MAVQRKLGMSSDQRQALLRNQVTNLLWYGRIETTLARAKEVRSIAEKMVTLAIREHENTVSAKKEYHNEKGQIVSIDVVNDGPKKLHARRLMMSYLYEMPHPRLDDESKKEYRERTKENNHPLIEKMFREYAPKYQKRNQEKNSSGGYTRIYKLGPRRGDAAERVLIEMV